VGAGAALARVLSSGPTVNLGGALMVCLSRARGDRVPWSLRVAWLYLPNNFLLPEGEVVDRWNAFALSACPGWGWRHSGFQGQACGRAIGGWITATDRAVTNPRSATRSWWGVGALLRGAAEIGAGFSLELEAGIDAPLVDRQFITTTPLHTVAETPPLSVFVGLGLSRRL
jgi:hypothetical protein